MYSISPDPSGSVEQLLLWYGASPVLYKTRGLFVRIRLTSYSGMTGMWGGVVHSPEFPGTETSTGSARVYPESYFFYAENELAKPRPSWVHCSLTDSCFSSIFLSSISVKVWIHWAPETYSQFPSTDQIFELSFSPCSGRTLKHWVMI